MIEFSTIREPFDVDVWRARLSRVRLSAGELLPLLTQPERKRAGSYRVDSDRTQFVAVRGLLRTLLGGYLARPPASVPLTVPLNGKPETNGIYFNVTHSHDLILFAFSRQGHLGVDVEWTGRRFDPTRMAEHCLTLHELRLWRRLAAAGRRRQFFRSWVRKEAVVKASGLGLTVRLDELDVRKDALVWSPDSDQRALRPRWHFRDVCVPNGYVAALAADHPIGRVRVRCSGPGYNGRAALSVCQQRIAVE
jgi:4'-phosphopantetheinyl transferase